MTETPTEPQTEPSGLEAKVDSLADQVAKLFSMFSRGEHDTGPENPESSIAAEVRDELAKLQAEETRKNREAQRDADIEDLKAKAAAVPERAPREYRRPTNWMKWATDNDR